MKRGVEGEEEKKRKKEEKKGKIDKREEEVLKYGGTKVGIKIKILM